MKVVVWFWFIIFLISCDANTEYNHLYTSKTNWKNIERNLQSQLITSKPGDTIHLGEGHYWFTKSVIIDDKKNLVFTGAGLEKTILSFKGQEEGAEGIKISNSSNIKLMNMTVLDANGDNIKVINTNGIYFSRVKSDWTGGATETNGAYGFYPVLCKNVLIEDCIAARASDAGIYVGQSDSVIIRNNEVYQNVAGIESENSHFVDIYDNLTYENTGGVLVFDLPGLTQYGSHTRVFNNTIKENNHKNFAPKGNIVGMVPSGTGIMILSTRNIEIFNNEIIDNRTSGTAIISYELVLAMDKDKKQDSESNASAHNRKYQIDTLYNPYPDHIMIHHNSYKNSLWFPKLSNDIGKLLLWKFPFNTPDILFDGFVKDNITGIKLCIDQPGIKFVDLNAPENLQNLKIDLLPYQCPINKLDPAVVTLNESVISYSKQIQK